MKLLIVAGGGGHFAPALAVIQKLPKNVDFLIVGRRYAFEADKTPSLEFITSQKLGFRFESITTGRLQRKISRHSLNMFVKIPVGFWQSYKIIKNFKPDVVLSFGGYVSVPVCLAASFLKIPIFVHEQTFGAGLSNKIVSKFAKKVFISWEQSAKFFPKEKVVLTGNPIKNVIASEAKPGTIRYLAKQSNKNEIASAISWLRNDEKIKSPIIYITGGSSGAHRINILIEQILEKLLEKYIVIHQTGDAKEFGDFDRLKNKKENLNSTLQKKYILTKFVDPGQTYAILEKTDLVVSRSGINTVTELLAFGKPALFIPLTFGQRNEQLTNALFVKKIGLAEVAKQNDLTAEKLLALIESMLRNLASYKKHSQESKRLVHKDAAEKIISKIINANQ